MREQFRRRVISTHLWLVRKVHGEVPVRLTYWLGLRSFVSTVFRKPDPLLLSSSLLQVFGKSLVVSDWQQLLWDDVLGGWALRVCWLSIGYHFNVS